MGETWGEREQRTQIFVSFVWVLFLKYWKRVDFLSFFLLDYRFYVLLSILIDMKEWNIIMIVYCSLFLMILWPVIKYLNRGGGILINLFQVLFLPQLQQITTVHHNQAVSLYFIMKICTAWFSKMLAVELTQLINS